MYVLPQEIEVWYIIPAIRKEMASCLIKDFSYSYDKVGKALGISKAAVSQYMNNKRASKIKFPLLVLKEIMSSCKRINSSKSHANHEIIRILEVMRNKKVSFEVCKDNSEGVLKDCKEVMNHIPKSDKEDVMVKSKKGKIKRLQK